MSQNTDGKSDVEEKRNCDLLSEACRSWCKHPKLSASACFRLFFKMAVFLRTQWQRCMARPWFFCLKCRIRSSRLLKGVSFKPAATWGDSNHSKEMATNRNVRKHQIYNSKEIVILINSIKM